MTHQPGLTICVPSRNRQFYFQKTIEGLLKNERPDVQFVFADNSDDPAIMNDFMAALLPKDPRIVYLPSTGTVLSMLDNWERTIKAATGEWVSFIGDDDFIDPDVMGLIDRVAAVNPDIEAFSWGTLSYSWPVEGEPVGTVRIPFDRAVIRLPKSEPFRRMFGWYEPNAVPTSGYSIYHSAIRRRLLQRIHDKYGQCYFGHAVVDYDMAMKVICEAQGFAFTQRPFSIFGACPASNSFSIGRLEDTKKKAEIFLAEFGSNFEADPALRDFPFSSLLGVTATIGLTQHVFRKQYGIEVEGWEKGFAKACALNTEAYRDKQAFETIKAGYDMAFRNWKGGRFLKHYNPVWLGDIPLLTVTGFTESALIIRSDIGGADTPAALWEVIKGMIVPADDIVVHPDGLRSLVEEGVASEQVLRLAGKTVVKPTAQSKASENLRRLRGAKRR
ncbi:glycosyltransferase family 2 protein [Rhizobium paknamense]|uniref:Glycosyltransferase involved in cell wall biosynthesis n=1 Tax=Rhizobium paknamense TaxID=1206817 RepID=A0ABU0IH36_9HYPH|nr:glycosyltransferase family 2 protein [Rhizobium paknamense]MDQ0456938.1 glycosyltransferase involved in cell wall biosynthesis [Rhizobium paknamense]